MVNDLRNLLAQIETNSVYVGTNYIGGTGEGQSDAAWMIPLCLQLFPAIILGVGMIFMVLPPSENHIHGVLILAIALLT